MMRGVLLMTPEQHEASHVLFTLLCASPQATASELTAQIAARAERCSQPHLRLTLWQVNTKLVRWFDAGLVRRVRMRRSRWQRIGRLPYLYSAAPGASLPVADFEAARERYLRCAAMFAQLQLLGGSTAASLAAWSGERVKVVSTRLSAWKRRGLVTCSGACRAMRWTVTDGAVYPPYEEFMVQQEARRRDPSKSITRPAAWVKALVPKRVMRRRPVSVATSQGAGA